MAFWINQVVLLLIGVSDDIAAVDVFRGDLVVVGVAGLAPMATSLATLVMIDQ